MTAIAFAQRYYRFKSGLTAIDCDQPRFRTTPREWFVYCRQCHEVTPADDEATANSDAADHRCTTVHEPATHSHWSASELLILRNYPPREAVDLLPGRNIQQIYNARQRLARRGVDIYPDPRPRRDRSTK